MKGQSDSHDLNKKFEHFSYPVDDGNWERIASRLQLGRQPGYLGEKFQNFEVTPAPDVWQNIAFALKADDGRRAAWWWYAAAAVLTLLVSYTIVILMDQGPSTSSLAEEKSALEKDPHRTDLENHDASATSIFVDTLAEMNDVLNEVDNSGAQVFGARGHREHQEKESLTSALSDLNQNFGLPEINFSEGSHWEDKKSSAALLTTVDRIEDQHNQEYNQIEIGATGDLAADFLPSLPADVHREVAKADLHVPMVDNPTEEGKAPSDGQNSTPFFDGTEIATSRDWSLWAGSQLALGNVAMNDNEVAAFEGTALNSATSVITSAVDYDAPIYYGVNSEVKFKSRLSIGMGLGYLQMQTTNTLIFTNGERSAKQFTERFLSIPFFVKYNFLDRSKFTLYTSFGHAVDIMIAQTVDELPSQPFMQFSGTPTQVAAERQRGNQANIHGNLGMSVKLSKYIGLFAEGSLMHYYFTETDNFFNQQKLWPGLRFGVLVSFEK